MKNVIIVGSGPAGITAGIYLTRAKINNIVITNNQGALTKAELIENYYGFSNPIKGNDLLENGVNCFTSGNHIWDKKEVFDYINESECLISPLNYPNCGSIFKNLEKKRAYEVVRDINMADYSIGGAKFSEKHANFIVNYNKAKASDIYKLIILAKKRALILEDVTLKEEVILLNFPSYKLMFKKLKK